MRVEDQSEVKAFLADPASHGGAGVDVVETHISAVYLAGDRALKLKQAVRLPYADFSTPGIRLAACEKELALNRAITPDLYLGVRRITREPAGLAFDGSGPTVDAVVEMRRFDQDSLLDRMAARGDLTAPLIEDLAAEIAAFHDRARIADDAGGAANIAAVLDINRAGFAESDTFRAAEIADLDAAFRTALDGHAGRLDARARDGAVRRCHGDLHLRNVCLHRGRPRLFDCIDFNDALATVDVLYDLAFMAMDLWHRDLQGFANLLVNRYLDRAGQEDGFVLLPFFVALRAAVRAHVTATQAADAEAADRGRIEATARAYFRLARACLAPAPARLVAIGGFSGSGKSTIAEALAPDLGAAPGARLLQSDRIRKAMFGVAAHTRLPENAYAPEVSARVYAAMASRAAALLSAGAPVVADAVHDRAESRADIAAAATSAGVAFDGVWLDVDPAVLRRRVEQRRGGPSDATPDVVAAQVARQDGAVDWTRVAAAGTAAETLAEVRGALRLPHRPGPRGDAGETQGKPRAPLPRT